MKRLLSSCKSQLVTKIKNIQEVHTEKYSTQYEAYTYLKRHLFKKDCLYGLYLQLDNFNNDRSRTCQKHGQAELYTKMVNLPTDDGYPPQY